MPDDGDSPFSVCVLSRHPSFPSLIQDALAALPVGRLTPRLSFQESGTTLPHSKPCLFILDSWTLGHEVIGTCRLLRIRHPGSKFVALVVPGRAELDEALRLLYAGFEGIVTSSGKWCEELAEAIEVVLGGRLWFPRQVISEYIRQTNLLLDGPLTQVLSGRENQVLQLLIRRLSNKEIAGALGISERTARFHVSNIFAKLRVENRTALFKTISGALTAKHAW